MMNFEYCVVELLKLPNPTVPRFVCIPKEWIRARSSDEGTTAVSFPVENFIATKGRILTRESARDTWSTYPVNVKTGCNTFDEGLKYAAYLSSTYASQANNQTNQNVQFSTPAKPAKRAAKRSMSVDFHSLDKRSKRSNVQLPVVEGTPPIANLSNKKVQQNKVKEKELLTKLCRIFEDMHEQFENVASILGTMSEVVDNIKSTFTKSVNETNAFLNERRRLDQTSYEFREDSNTSSKWTLRHQKQNDGLIELLPGSKVFVRIDELEKMKNEAKTPTTAARMLMMEIFSDYALSHCSLLGGKRESTNENNSPNYRCPPGLDKNSLYILMKYLQKLAIERKWEIIESQIWNSLRNKLLKLRQETYPSTSFADLV